MFHKCLFLLFDLDQTGGTMNIKYKYLMSEIFFGIIKFDFFQVKRNISLYNDTYRFITLGCVNEIKINNLRLMKNLFVIKQNRQLFLLLHSGRSPPLQT